MTEFLSGELEEIAATVKALNSLRNTLVYLEGSLKVFDSEGEHVGYIARGSVEDDWMFSTDGVEEDK